MKQSFTAENNRDEILKLIGEAVTFLKETGSAPRSLFIGELVLEEILTNIVKYGYDDKSAHKIEVTAEVAEGRICLEFSDDGHPFDPLHAEPPRLGEPVKTQRMGGRGLHLVRTMVKDSSYRREAGRNILTFCFPLLPS